MGSGRNGDTAIRQTPGRLPLLHSEPQPRNLICPDGVGSAIRLLAKPRCDELEGGWWNLRRARTHVRNQGVSTTNAADRAYRQEGSGKLERHMTLLFRQAAEPQTTLNPDRFPEPGEKPDQTLKRKLTTSPSFITYSLPSMRYLPASRAAAMEPAIFRSSQATISALMKPRSKSVWITPAH